MTPGTQMLGYVRVSTDEQGASGAGLEAQREAITTEAQRRGWQLLRIEEDVLTGRHMRRPGLQNVLSALCAREAHGLIVSKLDRLSRSLVDFASLVERAQREQWNLVALDLGVDLSTPAGEFLANVMASAAQWERRIISQRTKDALAVRRQQGVRLGRPSRIDLDLKARIRDMRDRGMTLQGICDTLNDETVPTLGGGQCWRPTSLRSVLKASA